MIDLILKKLLISYREQSSFPVSSNAFVWVVFLKVNIYLNI